MATTHRKTTAATTPGIQLRPAKPTPHTAARHRLGDPTRPGLIHSTQLVADAPTITLPTATTTPPPPPRPHPVTAPTTSPSSAQPRLPRLTAWLNGNR